MVIDMGATTTIHAVALPRHRAGHEYEVVRVDSDTHMVLTAGRTAGYVWKAGDVYVALQGPNLAMACEVGQSLVWDVAVDMVERASGAD
jgi:hypothetical protein